MKVICELVSPSFYIFVETFDGVPIPVGNVLESEPVTATRFLEPLRAVDETHGVRDVVFLAEFTEENLGEAEVLRCSEHDVEEFV